VFLYIVYQKLFSSSSSPYTYIDSKSYLLNSKSIEFYSSAIVKFPKLGIGGTYVKLVFLF
jgi:hypothetical protein